MLIRPFEAFRPAEDVAHRVAALPYDVYNRAEAAEAVKGNPLSFLNIDRPETQFAPDADMYADEVYAKARAMMDERIADGTFVTDGAPEYFVYELTMDGREQTGLVACCSIDEYDEGVIKKHENTLEAKEQDRIRHIDALDAQTGPIFLTYRGTETLNELIADVKMDDPLYDFVSSDGIAHRVWRVGEAHEVERFTAAFAQVPCAYIADGHHRCASAVKVGKMRREQNPDYTGDEEFNFVMSVLFPAEQLFILPYNRVVHDLNGLTKEEFLAKIQEVCDVFHKQEEPLEPIDKGALALYLDGMWYGLGFKEELLSDDPVDGLDVSLLQNYVLNPLLGIEDPRTSSRIDFVGGIRGVEELQRMVDAYPQDKPAVAFAMNPTAIGELLRVADDNRLMPPKSTWFEPKLRSGLFIHSLRK